MNQIQKQLAENKKQIEQVTESLLNRIVMIKEDLTAVTNDEVEEKQKIM